MDKRIIFAGLSLLLTACGGINYVGIETCNPGRSDFPEGGEEGIDGEQCSCPA
ncbi:MAG: hypothetical protein L6V92_01190 [Phocaeicola vulgatus]|nr:MAG: hypothetical protein L6V92_01190 [Phocaeicola vulgatus]